MTNEFETGLARLTCAVFAVCALAAARAETIFVEAEAFADKGGWVVDQQFMDQMGSPFLLAHGMGRPVKDAETAVAVKEGGKYRVLVRTRNWSEEWSGNAEAPGRFFVKVNGKALPSMMGAKGTLKWRKASDGGSVVTIPESLRKKTPCDHIWCLKIKVR